MKSIIKNQENIYPYLGEAYWVSGRVVVLFSKKTTGTVIYSTHSDWKVGDYNDKWDISKFHPYDDAIELLNE